MSQQITQPNPHTSPKLTRSLKPVLIIVITVVVMGLLAGGDIHALSEDFYSYKVSKGDSLWSIAEEKCGTGYLWWTISEANKPISLLLNGRPLIFPEHVLQIPHKYCGTLDNLDLLKNPISRTDITNGVIWEEVKAITWAKYVKETFPKFEDEEKAISIKSYGFAGSPARINNYIGPSNNPDRNTWPMLAYQQITGQKGIFDPNCDKYSSPEEYQEIYNKYWQPVEGKKQGDNIYHLTLCTISPNKDHFAFSVGENKKISFVVADGVALERYNFIDQLVYNSDFESLTYRALKKDNGLEKWYVITNENKSRAYAYVYTSFYTKDGNLYSVVKTEDEKWRLLENGKEISSYDYIDNILYTTNAENFLYRAKEISKGSGEKWFVVINKKAQTKWDYIDKLKYYENGLISYRARNTEGKWLLVVNQNGQDKIIFESPELEDLINYHINPQAPEIEPIMTIKDKVSDERFMYSKQHIYPNITIGFDGREKYNYSSEDDLANLQYSISGKHFTYQINEEGGIHFKNTFLVVDNKKYKLLDNYVGYDKDVVVKPMLMKSTFDLNENLVIYIYQDGRYYREVYGLN
ncbi:MAG: hypothetical protein WC659_01955 [Patescibacteria group bacterium]